MITISTEATVIGSRKHAIIVRKTWQHHVLVQPPTCNANFKSVCEPPSLHFLWGPCPLSNKMLH